MFCFYLVIINMLREDIDQEFDSYFVQNFWFDSCDSL